MLKRYSQFLESLMLLSDLLAISASWIAAYLLRFHGGPVPVYRGIPGIRPYLVLLALIVIIWGVAFKAFGLYRPRRISSRLAEVRDIAQACSLAVLILVALTYFLKQFEFSRLVILYFWVFSILSVSFVRGSFREILRVMRRRGYNLRHVLIVGEGALARKVVSRIHARPELGLRIVGLGCKRIQGRRIDERDVERLAFAGPRGHLGRELRVDRVLAASTRARHDEDEEQGSVS